MDSHYHLLIETLSHVANHPGHVCGLATQEQLPRKLYAKAKQDRAIAFSRSTTRSAGKTSSVTLGGVSAPTDAMQLMRFFSNSLAAAASVYTRFEDMMFEELPFHSDAYLFIPHETLRKAGIGKPVANV